MHDKNNEEYSIAEGVFGNHVPSFCSTSPSLVYSILFVVGT
jgi:hypothetical protein